MISTGCYDALNRFRAFRHRERSSYGTNLDLGIVLDFLKNLEPERG